MKVRPVLFLLLTVLFSVRFSCNRVKHTPETPDGGPCHYLTTDYPAKIIGIYETGDSISEIDMEINPWDAEQSDTISYYMSMGKYAGRREIESTGLKTGDTTIYRVMELQSGACNDHIVSIVLQKFGKSKKE